MTAADHRIDVSTQSEPLAPDSQMTVEYPPDCIVWVPDVMDGIVHFNMGAPNPADRGKEWCRKIVLRPAKGQNTDAPRFKAKHHDRVMTFFFFEGAVFRFSKVGFSDPLQRLRNYGPRSVLSLYSNDRVVKLTYYTRNPFISDVPRLEGTVVVVTWNGKVKTERCRHVAVVPNLIINWPSA